MAVLRNCALQRLRVWGVREKQAGGRARWYRVDICHMCLFIRNKAAPWERDRYSPESDWAEAWYSLSRGREEGRRSAAALYRSYTCTYSTVKALEPIHTQREIDTHTLKIHYWEARFGYFRDGLFISHYQVMSGNFISNQSAVMIYLFRLSW